MFYFILVVETDFNVIISVFKKSFVVGRYFSGGIIQDHAHDPGEQ